MSKPINNDMRPVFITYPTLYSLLMLNYFVYKGNVKFAGIILSTSHIKMRAITFSLLESFYILIRKSGIWYALYMFVNLKCTYLVFALWNMAGLFTGKKVRLRTFGQILKEQNIRCLKTTQINNARAVDFMQSVGANMIVSGYNNQILKFSTCKKLKHRAINIHNSYLPDFGGLDASFEVLFHGVEEAGATIHHVDKGIDTGEIISQKMIPVEKQTTVFSLNMRQWLLGAQILPGVLDLFKNGSVEARTQDPSKAQYPYKSFPEHKRVKAFLQRKRKLISFREFFVPDDYVYSLFGNGNSKQ